MGALGEAQIRKLTIILRQDFPEAKIEPMCPDMEGLPFDYAIRIRGNTYVFQVKTTEHLQDGGCMSFDIRPSSGSYEKDNIDFLFFYCKDEDWSGLAMLSECPQRVNIWPSRIRSRGIRKSDQFDFLLRMRELIETGTVKQLIGQEEDADTQADFVPPPMEAKKEPVRKPESFNEWLELLEPYGLNLFIAEACLGIPRSVLEGWRDDLLSADPA